MRKFLDWKIAKQEKFVFPYLFVCVGFKKKIQFVTQLAKRERHKFGIRELNGDFSWFKISNDEN